MGKKLVTIKNRARFIYYVRLDGLFYYGNRASFIINLNTHF